MSQHNTQPSDTQQNDIQHNNKLNSILSIMRLSILAECSYNNKMLKSNNHWAFRVIVLSIIKVVAMLSVVR